jgi:hypothetical protein
MNTAHVTDRSQKSATPAVAAHHRQLLSLLPFSDDQDFADARRGFIDALEPSRAPLRFDARPEPAAVEGKGSHRHRTPCAALSSRTTAMRSPMSA